MSRLVAVAALSVAMAVAVGMASGSMAGLLAPAGIIGRETLDDAVAGKHASIDGKVPAYHKGPHGRIFLGQGVRFVCKICLVLAAVHQNQACVATRISVTLVRRVLPPTTSA